MRGGGGGGRTHARLGMMTTEFSTIQYTAYLQGQEGDLSKEGSWGPSKKLLVSVFIVVRCLLFF